MMDDPAYDFALAWRALRLAFPKGNVVRITLRRKTGQWLCSVEKVSATGRTEAEAMRNVAEMLDARNRTSLRPDVVLRTPS